LLSKTEREDLPTGMDSIMAYGSRAKDF